MPVKANAAWASSVLTKHWADIESWLSPADADLMPSAVEEGRAIVPDVLGCGNWGCVMPTQRQDVVCKLTSDPGEARFVATAVRLGNPQGGVVRYLKVASLPRRQAGKDTFVLWREEAHDVGGVIRLMSLADQQLLGFQYAAASLARTLSSKKPDAESVATALAESRDPATQTWYGRPQDFDRAVGPKRGAARLLFTFAACRTFARHAAGHLPMVGQALAGWLDAGVLMTDVHAQNVGIVMREEGSAAVITDPGHAVFLWPQDGTVEAMGRASTRTVRNPPADSRSRLAAAMRAVGEPA